MRADLHTHSIFSDGELIPAELVRTAKVTGHKVIAITEVTGREENVVTLQDIFTFVRTGFGEGGRVEGYHTATGNIPTFVEELRAAGSLDLDMSIFVPKT